MPVAVKFGPGVDQHIFGEADAAQTSLSALHPADGALVAGGYNDHQVHVAVLSGRAPSVRAGEPDLLRLKFGFQSFDRVFQKPRLNGLHDVKISTMAVDLKAGFTWIARRSSEERFWPRGLAEGECDAEVRARPDKRPKAF